MGAKNVREKGIRFQGKMRTALEQATGKAFVTHSTELADIYPKDENIDCIFECKNIRTFTPWSISHKWIEDTLIKLTIEADKIGMVGVILAKGIKTGVWAIMSVSTWERIYRDRYLNLVRCPIHILYIDKVVVPFGDFLSQFVRYLSDRKEQ